MNDEQRDQIAAAAGELAKRDAKLGRLIKQQGPVVHEPRTDYFWSLAESIVSQQLSVKASDTIFKRLEAVTGVQPQRVLDLAEDEGRGLGLSRQKLRYLHDLAAKFVADPAVYNHLEKLSDDEVVAELTAVVGIGVWTAEMFLMFTLARPDVFAPDDIGLQRAMKLLYGWSEVPARSELVRVAEAWRPYRTVACWHLWRSLNNEG